jgi:DNA-binding LytR/AlgR family response regulator
MQTWQNKRGPKTTSFEPEKILRIQAQSNYCKIYFIDRRNPMVVAKVLHLLQKQLPPDMFIRVHKSHLLNKQCIKQVSGTHTKTAELTNGESIVFSRRKLDILYKTDNLQPHLINQVSF